MSDARTFKTTSSLAKKMAEPGGRTIGDALRLADAGVERHRDEGLQTIAATLSRLEALCVGRPEGRETEIYDEAAALLDMAGFFNTGPLHTAVFSLCDISDRMIGRSTWDWPSVEVHVRSIRLILAGGCQDDESARSIIVGLAAVSGRIAR